MDAVDLDLPSLVTLAGPGVTRILIERLDAAGFPGIKPSHGYVMQRLVDDEPTITSLARSLRMTQQGASKQVADLASLGYVERVVAEGDQRSRRVRLTAAGRGLLAAGRRERAALEAALVDRVGAECLTQTKVALAALTEITGLAEHVSARTVPVPDHRDRD